MVCGKNKNYNNTMAQLVLPRGDCDHHYIGIYDLNMQTHNIKHPNN